MPQKSSHAHLFSRYGAAVLLSAAAIAGCAVENAAPTSVTALQVYTIAVVLSAGWGGLGPGLLATVLTTAAGLIHFPPLGKFSVASGADAAHLAIYVLTGLAVSAIAGAWRQALRREREQRRALTTSEERLQLAVAATQDAIWDWDVTRGTLEWNSALTEHFGWSALVPGTRPEWWQERIHADDRERVVRGLKALVADPTQSWWQAEYRFLRADGSVAEVFDRGKVLRDENGHAVRMIGAMLDQTERHAAEAETRRNREQVQAIIDTVPALISYVDRSYIYRWNSRSYERWFQRPLAEITGRHVRDLLGEAAFSKIQPNLDRALAGAPVELQDFLPYEGTEPRWIHAVYAPHRAPDGTIDGVALAVTDISERKQAEITRASLAAIVENSDDAIMGTTFEGIVTSWNRAAERLFGYSAEEMVGTSLTRLFPPHHAHSADQILTAFRENRSLEQNDSQQLTKAGRQIDVAVTTSPIHDSSGAVVGVSKIVRDITAQKRAQQALRESEQRWRELAEAMPHLVWTCVPDGACDFLSRQWIAYTGRPEAEQLGFGWVDGVHPDDREATVAAWANAAQAGVQFDIEYRLQRFDGEYRWFKICAVPVRDATGRIAKWYGTNTDIEDLKQSAKEVTRARDEAEAANRAKDAFLAALSHELRTPLTPVLFLAATLERSPEVPAALREDFGMIRRNIELEARLIDDLLDLTRITRGKLQLDLDPTDAHAVLRRSLELLDHDIAAHQLALAVDLAAPRHETLADAVRLQQIFWNVLKNAVKFTPAGGRITVHSREAGGQWLLTVADTGLGITAEELPNIFDAFAQGQEASSHRFGGLGLGLAITQRLVQEHGGRIWAESPGRNAGASFHVELPLLASGSVATEDAAISPPALEGNAQRLLVVEDHEPTREALERLLTRRGYAVTTAASVEAARALAASARFALMISDLGLPDGSGHDLAEEFSRVYGLRGIALSGYGMDDDILRSQTAGFVDHLTKPTDIDALQRAIAKALRE